MVGRRPIGVRGMRLELTAAEWYEIVDCVRTARLWLGDGEAELAESNLDDALEIIDGAMEGCQ